MVHVEGAAAITDGPVVKVRKVAVMMQVTILVFIGCDGNKQFNT